MYYDGWTLEEDFVLIMRANILSGITTRRIYYKDINSMTYNKGFGRVPSSIGISTAKKKYSILPKYNIFDLAATLKFFQNQNIKVSLSTRDDEVELYLQGKIDSLPMTNDMKIND